MFSKSFFLPILNLFFALFAFPSYGSDFLSTYVTFEIIKGWDCQNSGTDWACYHTFNKGDKPAMMLITAYEGRAANSLDSYTRIFTNQWFDYQKIHVNKIAAYGHDWIDALYKHRFPNVYARFLSTVCCDDNKESKLHVFIGFYAHEENYDKYAHHFLRSIKTLKLVDDVTEAFKKINSQKKKERGWTLSHMEAVIISSEIEDIPLIPLKGFDFDRHKSWIFLILIFFVLGVFYFYYRRLKRRRRRRRRRRKVKRESRK